MVTLNRIYTRTGDDGTTGLVGGARIKKTAPKVAAYGDVDELNSHLGVCLEHLTPASAPLIKDKLTIIQNELFDIGAELATPVDSHWEGMLKAGPEHVQRLEGWIDELNTPIPPLSSFILPGGSTLAAHLHVARTVCRRAERSILVLLEQEPVAQPILEDSHCLSDLLFVMSRAVNCALYAPEVLWIPGGKRSNGK